MSEEPPYFKVISADAAGILMERVLDRRRKYYARTGPVSDFDPYPTAKVFVLGKWTQTCSGCHESEDGHSVGSYRHDRRGLTLGHGCEECGYRGKVIHSEFFPHEPDESRPVHIPA